MEKQHKDEVSAAEILKNKSKEAADEIKDKAIEKIKHGIDELDRVVKDIKVQYDKIDDKTKLKIVAGIAGTVAVLSGIIAGKAIHKKMKK